ncbi:hypothetical protein VCHA50O407_340030 [Vibrio chagasii]|uniref:Uncharacterized protein n=1 Tax=Vibrio crassostreae TaxID=246167 RepID=A0A822N7L1_9VIBR|nr:hypothetical protein VCHA50P424_260008 [Vibrio chagasii]CAK2093698.1 hypothetical protein VCRA2113O119_430027 [Vibrio crassostreae]CAH7265038.1 hypothetical protein VCHA50O407_340030 [Vibrio chagasii]CAK2968316.1 hypothetical protein VCRA217O134_340033 [Vibrio crassostreae]CAK3148667.1 hypothetical protein VCRA2120E126_100027 [Vibrio crassostreae]
MLMLVIRKNRSVCRQDFADGLSSKSFWGIFELENAVCQNSDCDDFGQKSFRVDGLNNPQFITLCILNQPSPHYM